MTRTFRRLLALAFLLPILAASPARAQLYNAGDPCPEPTAGRLFTQEGAAGPSLVCNGTTLEVDESVTTGPYARGVGTATPKAPLHVAGEAIIGATTGLACDADRTGGLRWNDTDKLPEFCDGTTWKAMVVGAVLGGEPPVDCPLVGDVCSDGTVFAGLDGGVALYVPRCDAGMAWDGSACTGGRSTLPWNNGNASGYVTTGATNNNGAANTAILVATDSDSVTAGVQLHQAAQYCADAVYNGKDDWYLPSKNELNILYGNKTAIGNFSTSGTYYWSSSTSSLNEAWPQRFSDGYQVPFTKYTAIAIRCARRGAATGADLTPDVFTFTALTNQALNTVVASNSVTVAGFDGPLDVYVTGPGSPQLRVNGGAWGNSLSIDVGDTLEIRQTTSPASSTSRAALVTLGAAAVDWVVTTAVGEVPVGNTGLTCDAGAAGTVRYNSGGTVMEYCNGTAWASIGGGASSLDALTDAATDYTTDYNMMIGSGAGTNIAVGGQNNLFIGQNAGYSTSTGDYNIAIGINSLRNAYWGTPTTGWGTVAIGQNTFGNGSYIKGVAIGYNASFYASGDEITAVGSRALESLNSPGSSAGSTAVGSGAWLGGGVENAILGAQTGYWSGVTSGHYNSAMGYQVLYKANGATYNSIVGYKAGYNISNATKNAALGDLALNSSTASYNTAVGSESLSANTTGGNNVAVGYRSGNSITTGTGNILLGYDVDTAAPDSNNSLNIGNTIYGNLSTNQVGIATATPKAPLHVAGEAIIGATTGLACDADRKGGLRWNTGSGCMEICNGTAWACPVMTAACDGTPASFDFTDQNGLSTSTLTESNILPITGTDPSCSVIVSVSGTGSPEYRICADSICSSVTQTWTASNMGFDMNGKYFQVRATTDSTSATTRTITANVGSGSTSWDITTVSSGPCGDVGPADIGTTCSDGSVYAGISPDGNRNMYVARCDIGMSWNGSDCVGARSPFPWNNANSSGSVGTTFSSLTTGRYNTQEIILLDSDSGTAGIQPHQATQSCADLADHGQTDWYLPARDELAVIYENLMDGIPNDNLPDPLITGFSNGAYWSSSEQASPYARMLTFGDGTHLNNPKHYWYAVRCARR